MSSVEIIAIVTAVTSALLSVIGAVVAGVVLILNTQNANHKAVMTKLDQPVAVVTPEVPTNG